jgi:hypothetical protein
MQQPLLLICAFVLSGVVAVLHRRGPRTGDDVQLGFVSQQWLAEHRASHPF